MRVLYVSTEVYPALKTGGLADVNAALPPALIRLGADVRMLLPAFPALLAAAEDARRVATLEPAFGATKIALLRATLRGVPVYFIDAPEFYARAGNPYLDHEGRDWPDNALRFALLGQTSARFADGSFDGFPPDIVHGHDWHAGLAPAYLAARGGERPGCVFTVHNLAFHGQYPATAFGALRLPPRFFAVHGLEFHGFVNFMKAGLHYADRITTVSPTYAQEIQTHAFGSGMDGLLRSRAGALSGILNGIDRTEWNPATDPRIAANYSAESIDGKAACKRGLQGEFGLATGAERPLLGVVSRLTHQKGLDLLLGALPEWIAQGGQLALLGSGEREIERGFAATAGTHRDAVAVRIGYDEDLAHRIVAGADVIAVPSRFEPCGLTQMYGLAYGTLPLVHRVGGLVDTVIDAGVPEGNGFAFEHATVDAMRAALVRVHANWGDKARWTALQQAAMRADFGWERSARVYLDLYRSLRPAAD